MKYKSALISLLLIGKANATFSIVAIDNLTGQYGIGTASCVGYSQVKEYGFPYDNVFNFALSAIVPGYGVMTLIDDPRRNPLTILEFSELVQSGRWKSAQGIMDTLVKSDIARDDPTLPVPERSSSMRNWALISSSLPLAAKTTKQSGEFVFTNAGISSAVHIAPEVQQYTGSLEATSADQRFRLLSTGNILVGHDVLEELNKGFLAAIPETTIDAAGVVYFNGVRSPTQHYQDEHHLRNALLGALENVSKSQTGDARCVESNKISSLYASLRIEREGRYDSSNVTQGKALSLGSDSIESQRHVDTYYSFYSENETQDDAILGLKEMVALNSVVPDPQVQNAFSWMNSSSSQQTSYYGYLNFNRLGSGFDSFDFSQNLQVSFPERYNRTYGARVIKTEANYDVIEVTAIRLKDASISTKSPTPRYFTGRYDVSEDGLEIQHSNVHLRLYKQTTDGLYGHHNTPILNRDVRFSSLDMLTIEYHAEDNQDMDGNSSYFLQPFYLHMTQGEQNLLIKIGGDMTQNTLSNNNVMIIVPHSNPESNGTTQTMYLMN